MIRFEPSLKWVRQPARQYSIWEAWNRNKRGIALDLSVQEGRDVLHELVTEADVFLTSVLPESRRKLGIDFETITGRNPGIVYAAGSGTGSKGPEADKGGYDYISFWSRGGLLSATTPAGEEPTAIPGAFGDSLSGMALAGGVTAALLRKNRTGEGCLVEGALLSTAMWAMQMSIVGAYQAGLSELPKRTRRIPSNPLLNAYPTSDGRWIALCMLQADQFWAGLCHVLGRDDLVDDARFADMGSRRGMLANVSKSSTGRLLHDRSPIGRSLSRTNRGNGTWLNKRAS